MFRIKTPPPSKLTGIVPYIGETIEEKMRRIMNNREPITDGAPIIYTERQEGVNPLYDIRTDKWDAVLEATTEIHNKHINKRLQGIGERGYDKMSEEQKKEFNTKFPKNKHAIEANKGKA